MVNVVFEYCCRSLTSNIGWLGLVGIIVGEGELLPWNLSVGIIL